MNKNSFRAISSAVLSLISVLAAVQIPASAQEPQELQMRQPQEESNEISGKAKKEELIEGVWDSRVTIRNCQTGAALTTFRAMETFVRGGSLIDTNAAPTSTRGPGFGRWQHLQGTDFSATFRFFLYNADGSFAGVRRVSRTIFLDGDNLTSVVNIEVFDPNDALVSTACATEIAKRVE